jgi:hypothetical protein
VSKASFWDAAWLVPVVWHADISAKTATALAMFVSVNSFFICFLLSLLFDFLVLSKIRDEFNAFSCHRRPLNPPKPAPPLIAQRSKEVLSIFIAMAALDECSP